MHVAQGELMLKHCSCQRSDSEHGQRHELRLEACESVMVCVCNVDLFVHHDPHPVHSQKLPEIVETLVVPYNLGQCWQNPASAANVLFGVFLS